MTLTAEARREAIATAARAYDEPSSRREAIALPYKDGKGGPYPVISVPVSAVLFNPRSHRIKAQLESHPRRHLVKDDPFSDEAQEIIRAILAATEDFDELKGNLREYEQREPGVVTREGLLVNANRRLAALRDLGRDYIRAALLPGDADEAAIDRLELELQVQREFKQDYTFTNELIFVDELLQVHGYSAEKVAKVLNWAASSDEKEVKKGVERVEQSTRLYSLVREIQRFGGEAIPLTFFDDCRQALKDLDEKYEGLKTADPVGADRMKQARIVGILSGSFYRELRKIESGDAVDVLVERLKDKDLVGPQLEQLPAPQSAYAKAGGTDDADLLGAGEEPSPALKPELLGLVTLIAESHEKNELELASGVTVGRGEMLRQVLEAVEETAEEVQASKRVTKTMTGPVQDLEEAVRRVRTASSGYLQVHAAQGFDHGRFKYVARKLNSQVEGLQKLIQQHGSNG